MQIRDSDIWRPSRRTDIFRLFSWQSCYREVEELEVGHDALCLGPFTREAAHKCYFEFVKSNCIWQLCCYTVFYEFDMTKRGIGLV